MPTLIRRSKWQDKAPPLKLGQAVIVCDPNESRNDWKRGRIIDVVVSNDGQVRSATIQTTSGLFRRLANKIAVLDVIGETHSSHGGEDVNDEASSNKPEPKVATQTSTAVKP